MGLGLSQGGKESACNAGAARDVGLTPGSEDSLEEGLATHSGILAWRISWTEGLAGYSPWDRKESDTTERQHSTQSGNGVQRIIFWR